LGSIGGAFFAALLIGLIHALGVSLFPQATLVLVFLTMAVVLAVRPQGLMGQPLDAGPREIIQKFHQPSVKRSLGALYFAAFFGLCALAWTGGEYTRSLASDALILLIFGVSLQSMMALGGLVSFGHAAFFGLGAYGAALSHTQWGASLPVALAAGCALALAVAAVFGAAVVRSAGVYLAMLSLALAQVIWATATQWVALTGGDNGVIGLRLVSDDTRPLFFVLLVFIASLSVAALSRLAGSTFGAALQAVRDTPQRAAASGLPVNGIKYRIFVESAVLAGLAGGLAAAHKGAVFPSAASVATSVDALLVVLLGGVHQLWGAAVGSAVLTWASAELGSSVAVLRDYWRGALGVFVMAIMVLSPSGLLGLLQRMKGARRAASPRGPGGLEMTLYVRQLVKHFGGVQAVKGVSFEVNPGECVALIGPNGAGKSTTFACIAGQHGLTQGEVRWAGQRVDRLRPAQRQKLGVARTFQVAQTFEALTVLQNLQLLMTAPRGLRAWNVLERAEVDAALARLEQVGLRDLAQADAKDLPYGAKKRLELAIALAGLPAQGPRLLLLDEPAAGLAGPERAELMARVTALAREGVAVLYTEHNMDAVFGVADRVLVLIDGLLAASGTPQEVALDATVRSRYLGRGFQAGDVHV
jgi:ABC-type branched-subunit amino acid transport system ATPase component/ABC-type branched-subunit amino acid transport system permease subunit